MKCYKLFQSIFRVGVECAVESNPYEGFTYRKARQEAAAYFYGGRKVPFMQVFRFFVLTMTYEAMMEQKL